jgi:hypothetical protein
MPSAVGEGGKNADEGQRSELLVLCGGLDRL